MIGSLTYALLLAAAAKASPVHDVLPFSDVGKNLDHQVLNVSDWQAHLTAAGWSLEPPEIDHDFLNFTPSVEDLAHVKRQACSNTAVVTDRTENFVDWDVQLSPVVCAVGDMTVTLTEGYSVSNAITVSAGLDYTLIAEKLQGSVGFDYSRTWTTSTLTAVTGTVPNGQCGTMIWKPMTTRRYGSVMQGCVGAMKKTGTLLDDLTGSPIT
ncbi:hypothetical protein NX059_001435 [Plenodomus lindquistii]|nr:hypothetical protein NX059_001435 [Plenodomus lindquistii]